MEFDGGAEDSDRPLLVLVTEALVIRETLEHTKKNSGLKIRKLFVHNVSIFNKVSAGLWIRTD
jgi:hypothetical protein